MDPYYFLNIELKNEGESDMELHDYTNCYPDGSWDIWCEDNCSIIYNGLEYKIVKFDNNSKILTFYTDENASSLKIKLTLNDINS